MDRAPQKASPAAMRAKITMAKIVMFRVIRAVDMISLVGYSETLTEYDNSVR